MSGNLLAPFLPLTPILAGLFLVSCSATPVDVVFNDDPPEYLEPISPENVVGNLLTAYKSKDIDGYTALLAPEFVFVFQRGAPDVPAVAYLDHNLDIAVTRGLFGSSRVAFIWGYLAHGPAQEVLEEGWPAGTMKVRIGPTLLQVDQVDGAQLVVEGDLQDLYLRPGITEIGEDPSHWFLSRWVDLPAPSSRPERIGPATDLVPVQPVTWGGLKVLYTEGLLPAGAYLEPTSPEDVVFNLQESYRHQEIDPYARLLTEEFIFLPQPMDLTLIDGEYLTRSSDVAGTRALFTTPLVSAIRIQLTAGAVEDASPPGVKKVRIDPTLLEVDQVDGVTWHMVAPQDLFFRRGSPVRGESPLHWFILEWHDYPSSGRLGLQAVEPVTWWTLKTLYGG